MCCILIESTTIMSFKHRLLLLLIVCLPLVKAYSQGGCLEYNNHLFVINIVNNGLPVKESQIKVYLVNEDSLPYWYETNSVNNYNLKLTPRKIKLNTPKNARNQKNPYETQSYYPKLNSNWYTCKIREFSPDLPEQLYQVLVINKKTKDSVYTYLPYSKSIDICKNNLDRETPGDLFFDDGSNFEPITIDIAVRKVFPLPQYPITNTYLKFDYTKKWNAERGDTLLYVYQARVHDKNTLAVIQKIPIENALPFPANYFKQNIETGDFYKDNPKGVADFRIMTAQVLNDRNQVLSSSFDHYVFDVNQQKYVYDKILSTSNNVAIKENTPVITKCEISVTSKEKYYDYFTLTNGEWVFTERKTAYLFEANPFKYQKDAITWPEKSNGFLPVVQMPYDDKYYTHLDSFALLNNGPDTLLLSLSHSYNKNIISIPEKIAPKETVYLKYSEWLQPSPGYVYLIERNTYVYFGDKSSEIKGFNYFLAAPGTEERDNQTGKIVRYNSKIDTVSNTGMVLEVYDTGMPKAFGLFNYNNGKKVDRWENWDEKGNRLQATEYGKKLTALIGNPDRLQEEVSIRVKTKTEWKNMEFKRNENTFILFVPMDADSLEIVSGEYRVDSKFTQWNSTSQANFTYYLLNSNDDYIDQMGIRYPITWLENEYSINWDVSFYSYSKPGTIENEVKNLQAKYPGVSFMGFEYAPHLIQVSIFPTTESKKQQLIKNLIKEASIGSLSQGATMLNSGKPMYLETTATIIVSPYIRQELVKEIADKYNGKLSQMFGTGNYYQLDLDATMYDKSYINLLHTIQKEPNVIGISAGWRTDINYLDE